MHAPIRLLSLALWCGLSPAPAGAPAAPTPKPFLGVHIVSVPAPVRAQTTLAEGTGLMVDFIIPDSPAELAGCKLYDILTNVGDQQLLSSEQFTNLIRSNKTGGTVALGILRQGQVLSLNAVLAEAPAVESSENVEALIARLRTQPATETKPSATNAASMKMSDGEGTVEIARLDNQATAIVKDAQGQTLFTGPINTPAERELLKPEVRARIEKLEASAHAVSH